MDKGNSHRLVDSSCNSDDEEAGSFVEEKEEAANRRYDVAGSREGLELDSLACTEGTKAA